MTSPHSYHTLCAESFIAEQQAHIELERHFETCPECKKIEPAICREALKIIDQVNNQPKEK